MLPGGEIQGAVSKLSKLLQLRHPKLPYVHHLKVGNTIDCSREACRTCMMLALQYGAQQEDIQKTFAKVALMVGGTDDARVKGLNLFFASCLANVTQGRHTCKRRAVGDSLLAPRESHIGVQEGEGANFFVAVHVGAGYHSVMNDIAYKRAMSEACMAASLILRKNGGASLDAVEAAIRILEDSWLTNAGVGSNLTEHGCVESDASIMDGDKRTFGAIGAVPGVKNPVSVAAALARESQLGLLPLGRIRPIFLAGEGARTWAQQRGLEVTSSTHMAPHGLVTEKAHSQWVRYSRMMANASTRHSTALAQAENTHHSSASASASAVSMSRECAMPGVGEEKSEKCSERGRKRGRLMGAGEDAGDGEVRLDTVGAVCVDAIGRVAAGVSSGGIAMKVRGRVGEAAAVGCGCWAANSSPRDGHPAVASSATGVGESIMRGMLARECCDAACKSEDGPGPSSERTLNALVKRMQAEYAGPHCEGLMPPCEAGILVLTAHSSRMPVDVDSCPCNLEPVALPVRPLSRDGPSQLQRVEVKETADVEGANAAEGRAAATIGPHACHVGSLGGGGVAGEKDGAKHGEGTKESNQGGGNGKVVVAAGASEGQCQEAVELETVELVATHSAASFGIGYMASTMPHPKALILRSENHSQGKAAVNTFGVLLRFGSCRGGKQPSHDASCSS